ncbi:GRP family sugar transporter [Lactobacillus corticis]|uniref:Glucose uptake protein n=1 Tax=Lactobacillus corticis TaxID=2201249 RepID=A0A916QJA6_9LACO|nr:GRP family sugar transporter [Lactobacillus corticis]GFZ26742.1 glucose uptake protein [Lactobacillus corticis]
MNILILFLPAICWGIMPLIVGKIKGGNVYNQIIGTVTGALVLGLGTLAVAHPPMSWETFWVAFMAGACWVIGQAGQFISYAKIGVSETMPISTGAQLIGVSLIGVLIFGEWASTSAKIWGFLGIACLIIGVLATSKTDEGTSEGSKSNQTATLTILLLTSLGYIASSTIPKSIQANGYSIIVGQTVGMFVAGLIYVLVTKQGSALKEAISYKFALPGMAWAFGALFYNLSMKANGVNMAFVISQLSVVISTLGGMLFLHERKSKQGMIYTAIGLVLIVLGAVLTTIF